MARILWLAILLSLSISVYGQSSASQENQTSKTTLFRCSSKVAKHKKVLSLNSSGESVEGPVCAQISINALRYGAEFAETITETAGPNLGSIFPSSFSSDGNPAGMVEPLNDFRNRITSKKSASLEDDFQGYRNDLMALQSAVITLQSQNRTSAAALDTALRSLKDFVIQSDTTFTNQGASGVIDLIESDEFQNALTDAINQRRNWRTSDELIDTLRILQAKFNALRALYPANTGLVTADHCTTNIKKLGWSDWMTKCRDAEYRETMSLLTQMISDIGQFSSDGEKAATIAKKLGVAAYWKTMSGSLSRRPDEFIREFETSCPVLFNRNRQVALKLLLTDRIPTFELQETTTSIRDNILIAQCGSRFSISAGVALSGIPDAEFAIVKGAPSPPATTSTSLFGILSDPRIHPIPIAIAHARLAETNDHKFAFHFSFGAGANVRSQASGGSSPEFLIGPSISFLRTIYFTGGVAIGKSTSLAGGFRINDTVPADVTAPQIVSSYTTRWGIAVTFTKP